MQKHWEAMSDEALAVAAAKAENRAFTVLVARLLPRLRAMADGYHLPGLDRDDLVQEGFLGVMNAVRHYRAALGEFAPYALTCAHNSMGSAARLALSGRNEPLRDYTPLPEDHPAGAEIQPQALVEAISQSDIQIAGTPTLSVETIGPDGYTFAAVIDLYPEVELGQYKGLSAVYPQVELSNDDTEAALDEYARANPDVQHPERAAMGDEVTLDFEGFVDGVPFEGGKGEQYPLLLGSGYFIPGFEEQVAGAAVGEERDVKVTFPTEYVPELAGKDAVFHIKVHQITRRAMPEWDDDFARRQGFADVSALRRAVMETAVQKKQAQAAEQFANDLIRQVTEAMTVAIPAAMVENQLDGLINELRGHLQAQGVSLEQYLEMGNTTMEQLRDHAREQAAAAARYELAMTEIAYVKDAPVGAVINEAVELTKKYAGPEDASYINGVLGGYVRGTMGEAALPTKTEE